MNKITNFEKVILEIEQYCNKHNINHRFVGGSSFGGLLNNKTTWKIDLKTKTIILINHNHSTEKRDDKSNRDIDLIIFEKDLKKIEMLKTFYKNKYHNKPFLSIENAIYYPQKLNKIFQFVTSIFIDKNDLPNLIFENVNEKISWQSLEKWNIILDNNLTYSVRNPIADYFAYHFRSPGGIKPKDLKKIKLLQKLTDDLIQKGKSRKFYFETDLYYKPWIKFINSLENNNNCNLIFKKIFMRIYWETIGNYFAHGKGFSKYFQSLSNYFTGQI